MSTVDNLSADIPAADVVESLRSCYTRLLEREGIAMFVAIDDLRPGRRLVVEDETSLTDGAVVAGLFDHYHEGLRAAGFPDFGDEDPDETGSRELIDVLVVLSENHLRARIGD